MQRVQVSCLKTHSKNELQFSPQITSIAYNPFCKSTFIMEEENQENVAVCLGPLGDTNLQQVLEHPQAPWIYRW